MPNSEANLPGVCGSMMAKLCLGPWRSFRFISSGRSIEIQAILALNKNIQSEIKSEVLDV